MIVQVTPEFKVSNLTWIGLYWEVWPDPWRLDAWVNLVVVCVRIVVK